MVMLSSDSEQIIKSSDYEIWKGEARLVWITFSS